MRNYYDGGRPPVQQPKARWQGGMWERPAVPQPSGKKVRAKMPRRRIAAFVVVLALLLGGTLTAVIWSVWNSGSVPTIGGSYDEDYDPQAHAATTIRRAEPDGAMRLELAERPEEALSLNEIYEKNINSIVSIVATGRWGGGQGTGVVMSENGYIITNAHVIQGTARVDVKLNSGKSLEAWLVGFDKATDLAVLKVEADDLQPAEFGQSDALRVGDAVVTIGNPLGEELRGTMTDGIISAINRDVELDGRTMTLLQTTAPINPGNSGGALINEHGQVVGITNMKMVSEELTVEGLGFAIPISQAKTVIDTLISDGEIAGKPVLGITVVNAVGEESGVEVFSVERSSDAWKQGLRKGDIIIGFNGKDVKTIDDLDIVREGLNVGDTVEVRVLRDGKERTFRIKLIDSNTL